MRNQPDIQNFDTLSLFISAGQVITGGWDKKVKFWDARSASSRCLNNLGTEVESMSLSGFSLMVALNSSVHIYDLRYLYESVQAKEHAMDIRIKCVRSNLDVEGIVIIAVFEYLVEMMQYSIARFDSISLI